MIKRIVPHICIILAILMLTLLILEMYNPWIISTDFFMVIMCLFFAAVFVTCGLLIAYNKKQ